LNGVLSGSKAGRRLHHKAPGEGGGGDRYVKLGWGAEVGGGIGVVVVFFQLPTTYYGRYSSSTREYE
jgi:hypothetical protein